MHTIYRQIQVNSNEKSKFNNSKAVLKTKYKKHQYSSKILTNPHRTLWDSSCHHPGDKIRKETPVIFKNNLKLRITSCS